MITFLLQIATQTFRDYFKALSFLSYSLVIVVAAIIKYLVLKFNPTVYPELKPFFQLSIFLFIPLLLTLVSLKFKKEAFNKGKYDEESFPRWLSITAVIILHVILILLFAYIIVVQ